MGTLLASHFLKLRITGANLPAQSRAGQRPSKPGTLTEFGHLFSGRYKALIVDGSGDGYLKTVCNYVRLNPARAKVLQPEKPLSAFGTSRWRRGLDRAILGRRCRRRRPHRPSGWRWKVSSGCAGARQT